MRLLTMGILERSGAREWWLLGVVLLFLLVPKALVASDQVVLGGDGGMYTNVALHVQQGRGLKTNLSLMHKGYASFPHPVAIYPLWPLVHGYAARVLGLYTAAVWVPTVLYLMALVFAYLWASKLLPRPLFPDELPGFNAGHVIVLIFGLNREFFWFTSLPYTEGLAFTLLFVALWRACSLLRSPSIRGGLELGLWLGLAFLTRSQMFLALLAVGCALAYAISAVAGRRIGYVWMFVSLLAAYGVVTFPYLLYVRTFAPDTGFLGLLRFDQIRGESLLQPLDALVDTDGVLDYLADRARGFSVAFATEGKYTYARQFYTIQYALPCAAVASAVWLARALSKDRVRQWWGAVRQSEQVNRAMVAALSIGGFISIHMMHKSMWAEWNFHVRHALTCTFAFFFSLIFLLRSRRLALVTGIVLLATFVVDGYGGALDMVEQAERRSRAGPFKPRLTAWINEQRKAEGELTLASRYVQKLWHFTPDVNYHSYFDDTSLADMLTLFDRLHVDYLIVPRGVRPIFMREPEFSSHFDRVIRRSGCDVFERRRSREGT